MKYTNQLAMERPALSAIRRALPANRSHLFLRLMPYSFNAPEEFGQLQTLIHECLTADDLLRRSTALTDLVSLFDCGLQDVPRRHDLIAEIAGYVRSRCFSCVAVETQFVAMLDMSGVTLDEFKADRVTAGVPILVGEVRWRKGEPTSIWRALDPLSEAVAELTSQPFEALAALPERERMAGIRLVRLFCMFGKPGTKAPIVQARLHFLRTLGIPVWRALAGPGFSQSRDDPGMYGEPAIRRLELALVAGTYAADSDTSETTGSAAERNAAETPLASGVPDPDPLMHTVVTGKFPIPRDDTDKNQLMQYEPLRRSMPVARLPSQAELDESHAQLLVEFPWAGAALSALFDELNGRRAFGTVRLGFHPLLLVGPSATGKSRLARRLAEVFGIQSMTISLAGMTDAMSILGTARGWSSGQPSPLLQPILKGCASVLMCFDELDKAADSTRNSPTVHAALLSLLEPEESKRWRDPFLQVECDLRPLLFVFTCNDTTHLSAALRSRLRILEIDRPTTAQLLCVVPFVLRDVEAEWGLPPGALDGISIQTKSLSGISSLRELRRAVIAAARVWTTSLASAHRH